MNRKSTKAKFILSLLAGTVLFASAIQPAPALARDPEGASEQGGGVRRDFHPETGKLRFLGADPDDPIIVPGAQAPGLSREARARAMLAPHAADFGLRNPGQQLKLLASKHEAGRASTRYQQVHRGIPVMAGELRVNATDEGGLLSINGEISPDLDLDVDPAISAEQARTTALQALAKWGNGAPQDFRATEPELWIYDSRLLQPDGMPAALVWRMDVTSIDGGVPLRELVLVDAHRGNIRLHFNQVDTAWGTRPASDDPPPTAVPAVGTDVTTLTTTNILTYTMDIGPDTGLLPGTFLCDETDPTCTEGSNPHADAAHKYAIGTDSFYDSHHGRASIDDAGMDIKSSVHYGDVYDNAFWNDEQMVYGDGKGYPLADDVVAHELTHGVTQFESNLFYYYQSGAINESFSDVWGELYDLENGLGNDAAGVRWQLGEDITGGGTLRSMSDPPASPYFDPDMMSSGNYYEGDLDNGGVHTNSGINNKAAYLMVDGDNFNTVDVAGIGADKTLAIYYEVQTNLLTSGADYGDLYNALYQACLSLVGGAEGIIADDCQEVRDATDAVQMDSQPAANFNTDAPVCEDGVTVATAFFDDLESGIGNRWAFANGTSTRWQEDYPYTVPGTNFSHSGLHHLYADDFPAAVTDAKATLDPVAIPANAYLHFAHAYDFEHYNEFGNDTIWYDGGVVEYSTNGGTTWVDAGSLFLENAYTHTLTSTGNNPIKGRPAFAGTSHGYISTRLTLASLAGQNVTFRWRMGLDDFGYSWGWWLDDVRIYTCGPVNLSPSRLSFGNQLKLTSSAAQMLTLTNTDTVDPIQVGVLSTTNSQFTLSNDTCSNQSIAANGGACTVEVVFRPTSPGAKNATLNIPSDAPGNPHGLLLKGTGVAGTQLLLNPSFETDSNGDKIPNSWTGLSLNLSQDGRTSQYHKDLSYSFKMVGAGSNPNKILRQTIVKSGVAGDDFLVGLWSKAENVPSGGKYRVTISIFNGSTLLLSKTVSFGNGTHNWELRQKTITAPSAYTKVRVDIYFQKTSGMAWFDLASLTWAP